MSTPHSPWDVPTGMRSCWARCCAPTLLVALVATLPTTRAATVTTRVIVLENDPAPGGNGRLIGFESAPVLNDVGQVAFVGLVGSAGGGPRDSDGIFRGDGVELVEIARAGQAAPDGNGALRSFVDPPGTLNTFTPALNNLGQASFFAQLDGTRDGPSDDSGLFRGDGTQLVQIVRGNQPAPDNNGRFRPIGPPVNDNNPPALNIAGSSAISGFLSETSGGVNDNRGIFRGDGSELVQIARVGQTVPDGNGRLSVLSGLPSFNDLGQAAFWASLADTSGGSTDDRGIFRGDGASLVEIARLGKVVPGGSGRIRYLTSEQALNDSGQVAFYAHVEGRGVGGRLIRGDGVESVEIAAVGDAAPDGFSSFSRIYDRFAFNNMGQVAFSALVLDSGSGLNILGIFRGDGDSLVQVARKGQSAPDGNGSLTVPGDAALNDAGQVAFVGSLIGTRGGTTDDRGIFLYDDRRGLVQVVRKGDRFFGSTIVQFAFRLGPDDERSGLNNEGQVAYRFSLADGRSGIAISMLIPEPSTMALASFIGVAMMLRLQAGSWSVRR